MKCMRMFLVTLAVGLISFFLPAPLSAQADGCPWCTTPTTCSLVNESTPYDGCIVTQDEGCFYTTTGPCNFEPTFAGRTDLEMLLAAAGIGYQQIKASETELWGRQHLVEVEEDLYAFLSCEGQLLGLVREVAGEVPEYLDPETYRHVYSIGGLLAKRATADG